MKGFLYIASPQQGDLRLSGPPSGQGAGGGARTRDRRVPADLRADSLATGEDENRAVKMKTFIALTLSPPTDLPSSGQVIVNAFKTSPP
ncbi:hypothetical protein PoB_005564600 [Plakobranchus ocellatus]|uniref:Uncharacterized protein n=1 Tax=Plakobranchus ocellatus TaxID=259542 RepID=A0AAV4C192_9GAST|nr:hypothetical protein PoB_005564600 [Plakobranchus ocellatus]